MKKSPTKTKITKLNINLFPESTNESVYKRKRSEYIANKETYIPGGFFSVGYYEKNPIQGEADWNSMYPDGYLDWKHLQRKLTAFGEQNIIDKINEIIDHLNK